MTSMFKSMQSFGVLMLVTGLFLGAMFYFHASIPEFDIGSYIIRVSQPPVWTLIASFGGGLVLLIFGLAGAAVDKAEKTEPDQRG